MMVSISKAIHQSVDFDHDTYFSEMDETVSESLEHIQTEADAEDFNVNAFLAEVDAELAY